MCSIWVTGKTAKEVNEFITDDEKIAMSKFDEFVIDDDYPGENGTEVRICFYPDKTPETDLKFAWDFLNGLPARILA